MAWIVLVVWSWAHDAAAAANAVVDEPARKTPVLYDVDVVVVGGGLSGVGAALGAARSGASTLVIERTGYLGGWLRGAGLGAVLGIRGWRPSLGEGVLRDISQRTVDLGMEFHPDLETVRNRGNLEVVNHEIMAQVFQSLLVESAVQIQFFSTYAGSIVKDSRIEAVLIETPVGRYAVRGKVFIDCTGLATVAAESDAPTKKSPALMGLNAIITGIDHDRFVAYEKSIPKEPSPQLKPWLENKLGYPITSFSSDGGPDNMPFPWDDWLGHEGPLYGEQFRVAVDRGEMPLFLPVGDRGIVGIVEGIRYKKNQTLGGWANPRTYVTGVDPTDPRQLSQAHQKSVEFMFKFVQFLNKYIPGFEKAQITRLGEMTLNRAGRSIDNGYAPSSQDINPPAGKVVSNDDAIAVMQRGAKAGIYEIPYRAMLSEKLDNLLAVGKSSAGGIRFRTHNITVIMGQAAGTAAAVAVQDGVSARQVDIRKVQQRLRDAGVDIPLKPASQNGGSR
ncbi:FAD-dependent oxidoreductase [Fontivita pretiosa]|uniref:FAD-dependent oxidoreductase n=1 Tax=Fontivita pretiosa TaxID=2989684 RepID=UPI003D17AAC6